MLALFYLLLFSALVYLVVVVFSKSDSIAVAKSQPNPSIDSGIGNLGKLLFFTSLVMLLLSFAPRNTFLNAIQDYLFLWSFPGMFLGLVMLFTKSGQTTPRWRISLLIGFLIYLIVTIIGLTGL